MKGSSPAGEVTTLSQMAGRAGSWCAGEWAVVAHLNMTSAEAAQRSTVLVGEQRWRTLRPRLPPALGAGPRVRPALMS